MGEGSRQMVRGKNPSCRDEDDDELGECTSLSANSGGESSPSDFKEEETTSPDPFPQPQMDTDGPLNGLSSLREQLPVKRGLSKHYQGKSQSFTSFSKVSCVEDLAKKEAPNLRKMKPCRSYEGLLEACEESHPAPGSPCKSVSDKASRGSCASSIARSSSLPCGHRRPPVPVQKSLYFG